MKPDHKVKTDYIGKVVRFVDDAFYDYIAARVLLLQQCPLQGAVLASTALEKYLKALLASRGQESHGHLKKAHWSAARSIAPAVFSQLNLNFLELCKKSYLLRYTDALPDAYNIVVACREFLAELDRSALALHLAFDMRGDESRKTITRFERAREIKDPKLLQDNHILLGVEKDDFIYGHAQWIWEMRKVTGGKILDVSYRSAGRPDDPSFLRPALIVPIGSRSRSYTLSHLPLGDPLFY